MLYRNPNVLPSATTIGSALEVCAMTHVKSKSCILTHIAKTSSSPAYLALMLDALQRLHQNLPRNNKLPSSWQVWFGQRTSGDVLRWYYSITNCRGIGKLNRYLHNMQDVQTNPDKRSFDSHKAIYNLLWEKMKIKFNMKNNRPK